jgi:hypothetical protein
VTVVALLQDVLARVVTAYEWLGEGDYNGVAVVLEEIEARLRHELAVAHHDIAHGADR